MNFKNEIYCFDFNIKEIPIGKIIKKQKSQIEIIKDAKMIDLRKKYLLNKISLG